MKKIVLVAMVIWALLVTGCASPSPWNGMVYQEANEWREIGVQASDAHALRKNGFTPVDSKPWIQAGIHSSNAIVSWHRAGFSPREAAAWINKDFGLERALEYKKLGLTVGN